MADLTVNSVIDRVSAIVQDVSHVRWPLAEKIQHITDALREICIYKPEACAKTTTHALVAGVRQPLPADCVSLLDVVSNGDGTAVRNTDRIKLDGAAPGWQNALPDARVKHWMFDALDQNQILVYPPQPAVAPGSLVIKYAAAPAEAAQGGTLPVKDVWMPVVVNYVLFRLYSKDADYGGNVALAEAYYRAFNASLVGRSAAEEKVDPRSTR